MRSPEDVSHAESRRIRTALNALPEVEPPAAWQRIAARLDAGLRPARRGWAAAAVAAAISIITIALWRQPRPPEAAADTDAPVAELKADAAALERALSALPQGRLVRGDTSLAAAQLEARLAQVDAVLKSDAGTLPPQDTQILLRQRVELLDSLVRVRYAETADRVF